MQPTSRDNSDTQYSVNITSVEAKKSTSPPMGQQRLLSNVTLKQKAKPKQAIDA